MYYILISSEAFQGEVPCLRTQHLNNVPRLRGEKHYISLKILHQAGFETARLAATLAERHALTIAPCPSPYIGKNNKHKCITSHIIAFYRKMNKVYCFLLITMREVCRAYLHRVFCMPDMVVWTKNTLYIALCVSAEMDAINIVQGQTIN